VALLGQAQTTRQGRGQALVLAFVLATAARVGGLTVTNMISVRPATAPLVYAIPLGAALLAAAHAQAGMRPRRPNSWTSRAGAAMGDLFDGLANRWRARSADRRRPPAPGANAAEAAGR